MIKVWYGMMEIQKSLMLLSGAQALGYDTAYLRSIVRIDESGIAKTTDSRSLEMEGLWFVGYGNWTGYASATLIGINRSAKQTIIEIEEFLNKNK